MRARENAIRYVRELALPKPERRAARAERQVEEAMRRMRDNRHTPERRAARIEAERRRNNVFGGY
jgi:hypothetical protein